MHIGSKSSEKINTISSKIVYRVFFVLIVPVLIIQYNDWWPVLPYVKTLPTLFLGYCYVVNHYSDLHLPQFRNTTGGLLLTTLAFFFISFHPLEWTNFIAMLFFIAGRLYFFYNIRRVSGFLIIHEWRNFIAVTIFAFSFFLFTAVYMIPKMSLLITSAIILYVFLDTLLVSSIYFLWKDKKLHSTGIWAIIMLFLFDLTGSFSMYIVELNDQFAISLYFGYMSIYLMYRFMLDLKIAEELKISEL